MTLEQKIKSIIGEGTGIKLTRPPKSDSVLADDPIFWKVIDDIQIGNNVFLVGEAGTGKTVMAESVARALVREFVTINCSQWTSPGEIIGGETITGYREGKLFTCWRKGKLLVLDEMPKLDPNTAGLFNDALAKTAAPKGMGILTDPNGETYDKNPKFGCIATGNTTGKTVSAKYGGNNQQDASLLDRFSGSYYFIGYDEKKEAKLTFRAVFNICRSIRNVIIAQQGDDIMTLRTMLNLNRAYDLEMRRELGEEPENEFGKTLKDAIESYLATCDPDIQVAIRESEDIDLEKFYNSYRNTKQYLEDRKRFEG